jgi:hypothetical protein
VVAAIDGIYSDDKTLMSHIYQSLEIYLTERTETLYVLAEININIFVFMNGGVIYGDSNVR